MALINTNPPEQSGTQYGYQGQISSNPQPPPPEQSGTQYGYQGQAILSPPSPAPTQWEAPEAPNAPIMGRVDFSQWQSGTGIGTPGFGNTIDYSQLGPYTRQVGENELVENRITGLLDENNPYIQNARRRGERAAAQRGALSSSIFAGSSEAAAIDAALPIASQDAQTYSRVASENAAAINQNTLARMNSMTSALTAQIGATASVTNAQIASRTNQMLGQMRIRAEENQTQFLAEQERFMQDVRQLDEMEIMELAQRYNLGSMAQGFDYQTQLAAQGFDFQTRLNEQGFDQERFMATMAQQYALDQMGFQGNINAYLQNNQLQAGFMESLMANISSNLQFLSQMEMDQEGYDAAMGNFYQQIQPVIDYFNNMMGGDFPPIGGGGG